MSTDTPDTEDQDPLPKSVTRERLTELFRRGEYRKMVDRVYRRLSRHKKDRRDAAEEIVGRALQKVLEKDRKQDAIGNLIAYLRKAVRNELHNEYRQDDKRRQTEPALNYELGGTDPSPEWLCLDEEQQRVLQQTVEALPPKCRVAFRWMLWENLTPKEVVSRFEVEGIKVSERQALRYRDTGCEACRQALKAYEQRPIDEVPRKKEGVG